MLGPGPASVLAVPGQDLELGVSCSQARLYLFNLATSCSLTSPCRRRSMLSSRSASFIPAPGHWLPPGLPACRNFPFALRRASTASTISSENTAFAVPPASRRVPTTSCSTATSLASSVRIRVIQPQRMQDIRLARAIRLTSMVLHRRTGWPFQAVTWIYLYHASSSHSTTLRDPLVFAVSLSSHGSPSPRPSDPSHSCPCIFSRLS